MLGSGSDLRCFRCNAVSSRTACPYRLPRRSRTAGRVQMRWLNPRLGDELSGKESHDSGFARVDDCFHEMWRGTN